MRLTAVDLWVVSCLLLVTLGLGLWSARRSGRDSEQYFLSGRNLPWWLVGVSMVATTFSTDTPNLVTDLVRTRGVAGNWLWWAFLLTGMLTVFLYARLWRRSGVFTDLGFYGLRYSGPAAEFLRAFRAIYLGLLFNVFVMAIVTLAAIKVGQVLLGLSPLLTVGVGGAVTVLFSTAGGFRGVVLTDALLFVVAMVGAVCAAWFAVHHPAVGGLSQLVAHPAVSGSLSILPELDDPEMWVTLLVIPLAVQWWSAWYPGSEPGGGGYVAQRMLAARGERDAVAATFFFNLLHYALRPWAWILVALASLVVYPDLASLSAAFPEVPADKLGHDLAYPAMLTFLPPGVLGLVVASLAAAYMSTISTHLNWGASYLVHDFYRRHLNPEADERSLVRAGRVSTVLLMVLSAVLALSFTHAAQVFEIILMFGAGTGLIFLLRWFWWRINAWSEIVAMLSSGLVSLTLAFTPLGDWAFGMDGWLPGWARYPCVVVVTTAAWLLATWLTPPEPPAVLEAFQARIRTASVPIGRAALASVVASLLVYSLMFATGYALYGEALRSGLLLVAAGCLGGWLAVLWKKLEENP
ncbi:MAG: sodium:solute symporter family protein [Steroidobacteraceae bacterium]